jgi:hypothetical protein
MEAPGDDLAAASSRVVESRVPGDGIPVDTTRVSSSLSVSVPEPLTDSELLKMPFLINKTFAPGWPDAGKGMAASLRFLNLIAPFIGRLNVSHAQSCDIWSLTAQGNQKLRHKVMNTRNVPIHQPAVGWMRSIIFAVWDVDLEITRILSELQTVSLPHLSSAAAEMYIDRVDELVQDLEELQGCPVTNAQKIMYLVTGLNKVKEAQLLIRGFMVPPGTDTYIMTVTYLRRLSQAADLAPKPAPRPTPSLNAVSTASAGPRFKALTPAERARCMAEGLCLYCRKPGHVAANCPSKPPARPAQRVNNAELAGSPGNEQASGP